MNRIGFFTTDAALVVRSWDAALEGITGVAAVDARGRRLDDIVPDLAERGLVDLIREPLASGVTQVLAPALHRYLIACSPQAPSDEFPRMQQRVVITPLRAERDIVGLLFEVEDVTERLEAERTLARRLHDPNPDVRRAALAAVDAAQPFHVLQGALGDEDWQIRRLAVTKLSDGDDAVRVHALIGALRDGHRDFSLLSSTVKLLSSATVDASSALLELLRDPDPDLRVQAALALGTQPRPNVIGALIAALGDPDANVQFHVIEALGKLRASAAVERLTSIAATREFFLAFPALEALGRIGDGVPVAEIVPLLEDPILGAPAASALGHIGDEDAIAPLVAALASSAAPRAGIVDALIAIHARYEEIAGAAGYVEDSVRRGLSSAAIDHLLSELRRASGTSLRNVVTLLGWLRVEGVERALADLLATTTVSRDVIDSLVHLGSPMVDLLMEQLTADDNETRRAAVAALGRIGDPRAVPALIAVLQDGDRGLFVAVAGALAQIGDPRGYEPLLRLIGDDEVAVRQAAIGALNSIGHPDMAERMRELLGDGDRRIRESAVKIAGYFGYPGCAEGLLRCTGDENEAVRAAALEHLAYLDDERVLATLSRALEGDTPRGRAAAAAALGHVDDSRAADSLRRALSDTNSWVRYFAAGSLGRHRDSRSVEAIAVLATHDPAPQVRAAAVEALGAIGGPRAVATLLPLCTAPELDVALAAIRALGTIDDASVAPALQLALRSADPARRALAAEALGSIGAPAVDALRQAAASDADLRVARAAADALASMAGRHAEAAASAVEALAVTAADPERRPIVMPALCRISESAIPALGALLGHGDAKVRSVAVDVLGRLAKPRASTYLLRALDDDDADVRQRAVSSLSRLGTRGAARRLVSMARADSSPIVRRAAERALSRSDPTSAESRT